MNSKVSVIISGIIAASVIGGVLYYFQSNNTKILEEENAPDLPNLPSSAVNETIELDSPKLLFKILVKEGDYKVVNGTRVYSNQTFVLKPELADLYDELGVAKDPQNTIVITPVFTAMAYSEPGFYTYNRLQCDTKCLTVKIDRKSVV